MKVEYKTSHCILARFWGPSVYDRNIQKNSVFHMPLITYNKDWDTTVFENQFNGN